MTKHQFKVGDIVEVTLDFDRHCSSFLHASLPLRGHRGILLYSYAGEGESWSIYFFDPRGACSWFDNEVLDLVTPFNSGEKFEYVRKGVPPITEYDAKYELSWRRKRRQEGKSEILDYGPAGRRTMWPRYFNVPEELMNDKKA